MKKFRIWGCILFILAGLGTTVFAQQSGLLFMTIDPGGRPTGMGGAYVAEASDVSATYWNPAGLAFLDTTRQQVFGSYSNWIPMLKDIYHFYGAYERHVQGWGHIGIGLTYMSYGEQERTGYGGEPLGTFRSHEYALPISFAARIVENLAVGLSFKFMYSDLFPGDEITPEAAASGYAFDLGFIQKHLFAQTDSAGNVLQSLSIGTVLQNIGPNIYYIRADNTEPLPQLIKLGFAYKIKQEIRGEEGKFNELNFFFDLKKPLVARAESTEDEPPSFIEALVTSWNDEPWAVELRRFEEYMGVEYWYANWIGMRAGYKAIWKSGRWALDIPPSTFTFGASLNYEAGLNKYIIDLSYMPAAGIISDTYRLSLTVDF